MAQKYLDINGLERYHDGLIEYMAEAVGTQADMSVQDPTNMAYIHNVPEWVRSETKPEYTATEVNADTAGTAQTEVFNHNISETAHEDIRTLIQEINAQSLADAKAYNDQKIADLINGAPTTLDTLKEIADAMATEQSAVDALESAIGTKANKADLAAVATSGKYSDLSGLPTIPTNNNQLSNGAGYITGINKSMVTTALGYTPPTTDTNTTYTAGTGLGLSGTTFSVSYGTSAGTACQGNDSRLSNARPASDVYSWAKAASKPSYTKAEVGLGNVDNTADSAKSVNYANSAGSASSATTAARLGRNGDTSVPMTFNWSGVDGQPPWLWGGTDGSNMYVYNPSNFSVNYANSAGYAASAGSAPASDVYSWAKASSKPSYSWSEISSKPSSYTASAHTHAISEISGTVPVAISSSQPSSGLWVVP